MRAKCCHVSRAKSYSAHANLACIIQLSVQYRFAVFDYNPNVLSFSTLGRHNFQKTTSSA